MTEEDEDDDKISVYNMEMNGNAEVCPRDPPVLCY